MSQHIGPRTISATGGSIKRVGNYRIHTFPSELVTDGLVLNLDAGDPRSYPSSGTTWTDLSGNGNNGTLVNGPTYSNADGGGLVFDGTNDYITLPSNTSLAPSQVTIEAWVLHTNSSQVTSFVGGYGDTGNQGYWLGTNNSYWTFSIGAGGSNYYQLAGPTYSSNTIVHLVGTFDGSIMRFYTNGVLSSTYGLSGNIQYSGVTPYIGQTTGLSTNRYWTGKIFNYKIYNRPLSAAEVAQNYDALRVRYGSYTNTFTPLCGGGEGKVEVLCVAGGGGGGSCYFADGGGGAAGAGGLIYNSAFSVDSNSGVSLTIGAGGLGSTTNDGSVNGLNGSNSTFSSLTAIGGGGGGSTRDSSVLLTGGSGGGAGSDIGNDTGGFGTSGQGNNGGNNTTGNVGAGGGGAGAVGTSVTAGTDVPNGGDGLSYSITGTSTYYAGGGGGGKYSGGSGNAGTGGLGGGGNGGKGNPGSNAIPNTGSGGGGGGMVSGVTGQFGGNGSNGVVIVRYPATDYNVELLIVGGGGGGGCCSPSAGGGGGGLLYYSSYPVSAGTKYSVTVGAAGTGANPNGNNGGNSIFGPLVVYGGGGGAYATNGLSGGSGGGGGYSNTSGGSGVLGQGNSGGNGYTPSLACGGGGGAGSVGGNATASTGGSGGNGLVYSISGTSTYYAAGGAAGAPYNGGTAGINPSGSGSGSYGGGGYSVGGNGGSGIIIIAYQGPQRGVGGTVDTTSRPGYTLHTFTTTGTDIFIP
jgi:hypothetical protein